VPVDFNVIDRGRCGHRSTYRTARGGGLDSIAQAAGRCNREGRRPRQASEVLVFATDNPDWAPPPELKQFAQVFRSVQRLHGDDLLSLEAIRAYFRELYWQKGP